MVRKTTVESPSLAILEHLSVDSLLITIDIAVVTPMFGGGVDPGKIDLDQPVSAKSVRGHLRFWWRTCHAARYATAEALFDAESKVWGQAHRIGLSDAPSAINVEVDVTDRGTILKPDQWKTSCPTYVLFPFREQGKTIFALEGVRLSLRLSAAPHVEPSKYQWLRGEAEAAIWAWLVFGGIGARTRRGCGALFCVSNDKRFQPGDNVAEWLGQRAARLVPDGTVTLLIPALKGSRFILAGTPRDHLRAWKDVIEPLRDFRNGRLPGQGKSPWPEADSIRGVSKKGLPYYPKADLGLPINFDAMAREGQPHLEAGSEGARRMASPLIIKPLAVSETQSIPLVLLLQAPHVWDTGMPGVRLSKPSRQLIPAELMDQTKSNAVQPLRDAAGGGAATLTARDAFLQTVARTRGWGDERTLV